MTSSTFFVPFSFRTRTPLKQNLARPRRQCRRSEAVKDLILKGPAVSTPRGRHKGVLRTAPARRVLCHVMEVWGFEPQTYGLQSHRSSHLSYTPRADSARGPLRYPRVTSGHRHACQQKERGESQVVNGVPSNTRYRTGFRKGRRRGKRRADIPKDAARFSLKGGDPAAPSGTATLLRLHPPYRAYLRHRPPQGLGERLRVPPTRVV